jgi:hypothetical protein
VRHLTVDIGRIIIDGLPADTLNERALRVAIESELARLTGQHGLGAETSATLDTVRAPAITATAETTSLGRAIAGSVFHGIGGGR